MVPVFLWRGEQGKEGKWLKSAIVSGLQSKDAENIVVLVLFL